MAQAHWMEIAFFLKLPLSKSVLEGKNFLQFLRAYTGSNRCVQPRKNGVNNEEGNYAQMIQDEPYSGLSITLERKNRKIQNSFDQLPLTNFQLYIWIFISPYKLNYQLPLMIRNNQISMFLLIAVLLATSTKSTRDIPFQVISFKVGDYFQVLTFDTGDVITYTVSSSVSEIILIGVNDIRSVQGVGSATLSYNAVSNTPYFFYFQGSFNVYSAKTVTIKRNGAVVFSNVIYSPYSMSTYHKFSVQESNCQVSTIKYYGPVFGVQILLAVVIWKYQDFTNGNPPLLQFIPQFTSTYQQSLPLPAGDYILFVGFQLDQNIFSRSVSVSLTTSCTHFCKSSFNIPQQQLCIPTCGDGVKGETEECDNGNKLGCSRNCVPDPNYVCYGPVGSGSFCIKQPICGDGILDQGEICDNGNKAGCSSGCKNDQGYRCTQDINKPSLCSLCGNGILENGEECDNRNQLGCSSCKIQPGFDCRGIFPSICVKKDPVCGNGIIEIAEMCDDGNRDDGDGCSRLCRNQVGFSCSGDFGQRSSCFKSQISISICGNAVFQPYPSSSGLIEQCDNGNQQGCQGCQINFGWFCSSFPGQLSSCFKVTAPTCGNRLADPGEQCDDGNLDNRDGCNFRCQVEFGWSCPTFFQCNRNQNPPLPAPSTLCGNGIVEGGEECDDLGFPVKNGDGCSIRCRTQSGWTCNVVQGQSTCRRLP